MGVVRLRLWRGQEDERGIETRGNMGAPNQLLANPAPLVDPVYRQIGQVGAIAEVCDGARDANQETSDTGGHNQVRVLQHLLHGARLGDRPSFRERRTYQEIHKFLDWEVRFNLEIHGHGLGLPFLRIVASFSARESALIAASRFKAALRLECDS
jgi:hypothetical protein